MATTVKLIDWPAIRPLLSGGVTMVGAAAALTVTVTLALELPWTCR